MGNIIAELHRNTVFLFTNEAKIKGLAQSNAGRIRLHKALLATTVLEVSFALFIQLLDEHNGDIQAQQSSINIIWIHNCHSGWLKSYQGAKVKIQSKEVIISNPNTKPLFNFIVKASPLNFGIKCEQQNINFKAKIPEQHIRLELENQVKIWHVENDQKLVYKSNIGEDFHFKIITELLEQQYKEALLLPFSQVLEQIFEKGNHEATDMLVGDIFGQESCAFIGLPPRLIAASLGKLDGQHNVWDEAKSIIVAFAINIGLQLKQQMLTHKVFTAVLSANQFAHPAFFHLIQGIAGLFGSVWFQSHPMLQSFLSRLSQ